MAVAAVQFPSPLIAQTKPFAGVTLRGASYQHQFLTILQGYVPEFEQETGMKVDLRLSPFPVRHRVRRGERPVFDCEPKILVRSRSGSSMPRAANGRPPASG